MIFRSTVILLITALASANNCPAEKPPEDGSGVECPQMNLGCGFGLCTNEADGLTGVWQCRCPSAGANWVCSCRGAGLKEDGGDLDVEGVALELEGSGASVVASSLVISGAIVAALL